jgi:hypothetical protein
MKIPTFLPIFSGFYGTIWEMNTENFCHSESVNYDDLEIDNESYERDIVQGICRFVQDNCPFIKSVKLEEIVSPKEYNFYNDSGNVLIDYDVQAFANWLIQHEEDLDKYLRKKYTSCSGFISSYSNQYFDWFVDTKGFKDLAIDGHRLGSLLDFYFQTEMEDAEMSAYYDVTDSMWEGEYITIRFKHLSDLDSVDLEILAENIIDKIEPFGYFEVLCNEYQNRYKDTGICWKEMICKNETMEVIKAYHEPIELVCPDTYIPKV